MRSKSNRFIENVVSGLHLDPVQSTEIVDELQAHIEDRAQDLVDDGLSVDHALRQATIELGESDSIAKGFYEVHSRRSWRHAFSGALPHILLALMFALHVWTEPVIVAVMLGTALVISVLGWRAGRPTWTFPWLGYCILIPLISWGLAMSAVGYGAWGVLSRGSLPLDIPIYIVSLAYIALSMWVVIKVVSRVARNDWLMASLTVLPIPFLAYWFLYFYNQQELFDQSANRIGLTLQEIDSTAAIIFLIMAAATIVFFRVGRRTVRLALLAITTPSVVVLAWLVYKSGIGALAVFAFAIISIAVLMSPALFDRTPKQIVRATLEKLQTRRKS